MTSEKRAIWPLILMMIWYAFLLVGAGIIMLVGFSFGNEAYRGAGIPLEELLTFTLPLFFVIALTSLTIWLWSTGRRKVAYGLCAISLLPLPFLLFAFGLVI